MGVRRIAVRRRVLEMLIRQDTPLKIDPLKKEFDDAKRALRFMPSDSTLVECKVEEGGNDIYVLTYDHFSFPHEVAPAYTRPRNHNAAKAYADRLADVIEDMRADPNHVPSPAEVRARVSAVARQSAAPNSKTRASARGKRS